MGRDDLPPLTVHARSRWSERCAGLDIVEEWYTLRRPGAAVRRKIRDACPGHARLVRTRTYQGVWYGVSRNRVVFVIDGVANRIITVWRLLTEQAQAQ